MTIPTLIDLVVSGSSVALRYSEALSSILPSVNRFIIKVNGKRVYATGQATLNVDGTTILLKLTDPVAADAKVTLAYGSINGAEKPGFGDIRSLANGQKVAFLRDSSVINRTLAPTVAISSSASTLKVGETATISFTFSDIPSGFTAADIATSGGSLSGLVVSSDPKVYTAIFTPTAGSSGTASISVAAGSYSDAAGNSGAGGSSAPISFDTLAPTLAISSSASTLKVGETATISFTFSDIPSGFTAADIATSGGSLSGLVVSSDPKVYTAIFTPTEGSSGTASIAVASGSYTDAAGNSGAGGSSASISFDTLAPTLAISSDKGTLKAGETATILFSFSEIPSEFDASDITTSGGSLSALSSTADPKVFSALFTPTAGSSGTASIAVASGSYTDAAGNSGAGGSSASISFDTLAPTLAISSDKGTLKAGETATILFSFSEIPSGFDASDITTSGGSLSALSTTADPQVFSALFTPTPGAAGTASISVAAGLYSDAAGNSTVTPADLQINLESGLVSLSVGLSASTDTGTPGDGITSLSRVSLIGQGQGGVTVSLRGTALRAVISGDGAFQLTEVPLATGDNVLTLDLLDGNGNSVASRELPLTLQAPPGETSPEDPVLAWNRVALEAIQRDASLPTYATRALAMQAIAVLDTLAAIDGTPAFLVGLAAPVGVPSGAAVAAASARVLSYLYPSQKNLFLEKRDTDLQAYTDAAARQAAVELGEGVADVVIALRDNDGWDRFVVENVGNQPGQWRPTPPAFDLPQAPHWAQLTPFSLQSGSQFRPDAPPALTSAAYAEALNEVKSLGSATSSTRTGEQTQIARFWADGLGSYTPPGHWNQIADQQATADGFGYGSAARLLAILNVALADSSIAAWDAKYAYDLWRPVTAIRNADSDGNPETTTQSDWQPLLITPSHPEYVSGHSTYSAAAAEVLTKILGDRAFDTTSIGLPNVTRSFSSFEDAAAEAGRSRIYGGIHYEFSNQAGQALGTEVAGWVLDAFRTDIDLRGPQLALQQSSGQVWSSAPLLSGFAVDNLSGVKSLSVTLAGLDPQLLSVDSRGRFSLDVGALFGPLADGAYGLTFKAVDGAGNASQELSTSFRIDTTAPSFTITSLSDGAALAAGARLSGVVDGTGSAVKSLSYRFNNGVARSLVFDASSGAFDVPLSLGDLSSGDQTLTLTAEDSAGLHSSRSLTLRLPQPVPLTIAALSPADGSAEVGSTFRPELSFSRAVDPTTVTADSFWATDAAGNRLKATIVMAPQGTRAWLLFEQAMPGGSRINLRVDGNKIRAAGDGQLLDADGDGTPGGSWNSAFTTVNLTPVAGTTLVGKVVGPGADLKPMSYDDFRAGPDGAAHTADDVFLEPLAGVKVFILGLENRVVFTDAQGRFELKDVPVGVVKVAIDGRTATNPLTNVFYPEMVMDVTIRPAQVNTIMGTMGTTQEQLENFSRTEVYLPRISTKVLTAISPDAPTTVTTPAEGASNLTEQQRQLIQLLVQPGSVIGENGQVLDDAKVGIATVPPELVRDMLPPGLLQHTFDLTIQAPGAAVFNTPLQLTLPNVFNAAPGTKLNLLSFDHTNGRLVIDGTGTVSVDGEFVVTDPDSGITRPGWHGMTPPGSPTKGPNLTPPPPPCKPESGLDKAKFYSQLAKDLLKCASELTTGKIGKLLKVAAAVAQCADEGLEIAKRVRDLSAAIDKGATQDAVLNTIGAIRGAKGVFEAKAPGVVSDATSAINQAQAVLSCAALLTSQANEACKSAVNDIDCNPGTGTWGVARDLALKGLCSALAVLNSVVASFERAVSLASNEVGKFVVGAFCEAVRGGLDGAEIWARNPLRANEMLASLDALSNADLKKAFITDLTQAELVQLLNDSAAMAFTIAADGSVGATMAYEAASSIESNLDVFGYNGVVGHIGKLSQIILGLASRAPYLVEFDGVEIRGRTDEAGQIDVFLPPSTHFSLSIYNSTYNIVGRHEGKTSLSGTPTVIQSIPYISSPEDADSDNDGLSDLAERILGSSLSKADTDSDGVSDMAEVQAGQDPLGGFLLPTGVVGSLGLQGRALDLALATDPANPTSRLALVATGNGISVVDLSNALSPSVVASLQLSGNADSIAYDPSTRLAAVALGNSLAIVDLSTPTAPSLARTVAVAANQVELLDGVAYVITGSSLQAYDLLTGDQRSSLSFFSGLTGLAREGSMLYLQDQSNRIHVVESVDGTGDLLLIRGSITLPYTVGSSGERKLFVAEDTLYVPADDGFQGGFATVDVKKPTAPVVLSGPDDRALAGKAIALTGSGRAVIVGNPGGVFGTNVADVINTSDPLNTGAFITRINMSARPNDVAIASGFAFVATDTGLQVVNFLPRDVNGIAPTVSIDSTGLDIDPTTPGLQVPEGSIIPLKAAIADDVLVSRVDLLVNGSVIRSDSTYPFDLRADLPTLSANGGSSVRIQVRATDTGGNVGLSTPLSLQLIPDPIAPVLLGGSLRDGAQIGRITRSLTLTFSEPVVLAGSADSVFSLQGPNGSSLAIGNVLFQSGGRQLQLTLANQLQAGAHFFTINGALLKDLASNALSADPINLRFTVVDLLGTNGNDTLIGTETDDIISPLRGRDSVDGRGGDDLLIVDYSGNLLTTSYAGLSGSIANDSAGGFNGYYYAYYKTGDYDQVSFSGIERFQITGTVVADQITTGSGNDTIDGGKGNDTINAGAGDDSINAGEGDDLITALATLDILDGGPGFDTVADADFSDVTIGLSINDSGATRYSIAGGPTYSSVENFSKLTLGSGDDDVRYTRRDRNTINTGAGNDQINSGFGRDTVDGGTGNDLLIVDYSGNLLTTSYAGILGSIENDSAGGFNGYYYAYYKTGDYDQVSFSGIERFQITGTFVADQITTGSGNDTIDGGKGSDTINAGFGNDSINAGEGDDLITALATLDILDGGPGFDTVADADFSDVTIGLSINDSGATRYSIAGGPTYSSVENFSKLTLGSGDDDVRYTRRDRNTINTGAGNDQINSGFGRDTVDGGTGNDLLIVDYSGNLHAGGFAGISGSISNDSTGGFNGYFYAYYNSSSDYDQVSFGGIERFQITGTVVADQITTGSGNDTIDGGKGNDTINGGAGDDSINAGEGDDLITALSGLDILDGGPGFDTVADADFSDVTIGLSINDSGATRYSIAGGPTFSNVENFSKLTLGSGDDDISYTRRDQNTINTGAGDDKINSGFGRDTVDGGTGNDLLIVDYSGNLYAGSSAGISGSVSSDSAGGFKGNFYAYYNFSDYDQVSFSGIERFQITGTVAADRITTGSGNDTIDGGMGNDTINAGAGDDIIIGGLGADRLQGGTGADQFFYNSANEGSDQITDFDGIVDSIIISAAGFGGLLSAGINILATGHYVENTTGLATSAAGVGQLIYQTNINQLLWDGDGSGGLSATSLATFQSPQAWSGSCIQVVA
jgi:Ca2+-binding RTX toxin-like protein